MIVDTFGLANGHTLTVKVDGKFVVVAEFEGDTTVRLDVAEAKAVLDAKPTTPGGALLVVGREGPGITLAPKDVGRATDAIARALESIEAA